MAKPNVLRGVLVTEPEVYQRLRSRRGPWRQRLLEAARRAISLSISALAHILIALLLIEMIVTAIRDPGDAIVEVGLSGKRGEPATAAKEEAPPQPEPPKEEPKPEPPRPADPGAAEPKTIASAVAPAQPAVPDAAPRAQASKAPVSSGNLYGNRGEGRAGAAARYGGTDDSEAAVERALDWLARHQQKDGSWRLRNDSLPCANGTCRRQIPDEGHCCWDREYGQGEFCATGLTSLVLLAFLGAGYTHQGGSHAETVSRALRYVLRRQGGSEPIWSAPGGLMYEHGVSTLALSEAYGLTRDTALGAPLRRAIAFMVRAQTREGGWTYGPQQHGVELTQTVWQLFALVSARKQRIEVPEQTLARAAALLRRATCRDGSVSYRGQALDRLAQDATLGSLGAGTFARMVLGVPADAPFEQSMKRVVEDPHVPSLEGPDGFFYFWYYKSLVLFQLQDEAWKEWNANIRNALVARQEKDGHAAGCWVMRDLLASEQLKWSYSFESRAYVTALAALTLEVYYRYLPFYGSTGGLVGELPDAQEEPPEPAPEAPVARKPANAVPTVEEVRAQLASPSSSQRWLAARRAAELKMKELWKEMLEAVGRDGTDIAGSILESLGQLGEVDAAPEIIPYLSDERERVRRGARSALARLAGRDLGDDAAAWRQWWQSRGKK